MLDPLGGNSLQYLFVWFFIASWTFIDPGFIKGVLLLKIQILQKKVFYSYFFWAIFDFLTLICGLYAIETISPDQALLTYPILAFEVLPSGFLGIFLIGIIATIMSTIDSLSLVSAVTFGRDILWRIEANKSSLSPINFMKKGLIIISFFSLVISYLLPSVVALFYTLGSLLILGLFSLFYIVLNETID